MPRPKAEKAKVEKAKSSTPKTAKRKFSGYTLAEAYEYAGVENLSTWTLPSLSLEPTAFFIERLKRLRHFDTVLTESGKELIVDAFVEEVMERHEVLKIWKSAPLSSDQATGFVDYLLTEQRGYIATPLLCVVEAKKDDFEQGLAQCLVGMKAGQWRNQQKRPHTPPMPLYGIVTNGDLWRFYRLEATPAVYESQPFLRTMIPDLLGTLDWLFAACESISKAF